jgi:hypothetical protein
MKRAFDPSDKLDEHAEDRREQTPKPEPNPSPELPYQSAPTALLLSDLAAQIEGVPRWGLNE